MNLAFAVLFLWAGCSLLYLASHGVQATSPWQAYQTIIGKARGDG